MTTRDAIFRAFVQRYDAGTGVVSCTIPKLYGRTVLTARPAVGQPSEITSISPPAVNSVVFVFFDGGADNSPFWIPRVLDSAYTDMFVNIAGDTMTGELFGTDVTLSGDLTAVNGVLSGNAAVTGGATITGDVAVNGGNMTSSATTFNLLATPTTVNVAQAATAISIGATTGLTTIRNRVLANGTGVNEQVTLQVTGTPTGGSFILMVAGVPVTLTYNSTTLATTNAFNAQLGAGAVTVTGGTFPGAAQVVTFTADYAGSDVQLPALVVNQLTGGTSPSVTITLTTPGAGAVTASTVAAGVVSGPRALFASGQFGTLVTASLGTNITTRTADVGSSAIIIPATVHQTSERAGITIGDWIVGQDLAGDGTKNFFFWNGSPRLQIGTGGLIKIGNAGESLRFVGDNSYLAFFEGTEVTRRAFLQATSTLTNLVSEVGTLDLYGSSQLFRIASGYALLNGYMRIGTWPANGAYTGLVERSGGAANNYMIMADTNDTLISTPGSTGVVRIRPRNNGTAGEVTIDNTFLTATGNISTNGQLRCYRNGGSTGSNATDAWYYNASVYAATADINGASTASIAFHPSGVAPQLRVGANDSQIYNRAADGSGNNPFTASAFNVASTRRIKTNITDWPRRDAGAASESAAERLSSLRVVTFDRNEPGILKEVPSGRRSAALQRLNEYTDRAGLPRYELPDHDCSIHECNGTADESCARVLNTRRMEYGLIAEEVNEVFPEAVVYDGDRLPNSINYSMINAITVAAVQELLARIEELEARLAA